MTRKCRAWRRTAPPSAWRLGLAVAATVALGTSTRRARASDNDDLDRLLSEPVVTTASKAAEAAGSAPATSSVLTAEDIRRYGIRTIAEAIDFLSLSAATSPNGEGGDVGARGVLLSGDGGNHVLLLLNGHVMNESLGGSARFDRGAGIPIELVDHIEVILGPGSVLYGSNAMLGVVNIITKRAKDFAGAHLVLESELPSSVRLAGGAGYTFKFLGTDSEATFQLEYFGSRGPDVFFQPENVGLDPATGEPARFSRAAVGTGVWGGTAHNVREDTPAAVARVSSGDVQLTLRASADTKSRPTSPLSFDDPDNQTTERWASFDLAHRASLSPVAQMTTRVYGDLYTDESAIVSPQVSFCRVPGANCKFVRRGDAQSLGSEIQGSFDWFQNAQFVSIVGVDGRVRAVGSESRNYQADTGVLLAGVYGNFTHRDVPIGAYTEQRWSPTGWVSFNAGARVDNDARFPARVSPRFAVSTNPWPGGTIRLIYAEAFRAPTWNETAYSEPTLILPNGLRPEGVRSIEISAEEHFGAHRVLIDLFRSRWTDLIELQTLSPGDRASAIAQGKTDLDPASRSDITQMQNVASIDNYGLNAAYEGAGFDGNLHYGLNATAAIANRSGPTGQQPLTVAPRTFGNARVAYDLPPGWPTLAIAAQYLGRRMAYGGYDGTFRPPPLVSPHVELRGTVSGKINALPRLSYRIIGAYTFGDYLPYVVGPVQEGTAANPAPNFLPVRKTQLTVGLQYDF